jgi:hypothetical protein
MFLAFAYRRRHDCGLTMLWLLCGSAQLVFISVLARSTAAAMLPALRRSLSVFVVEQTRNLFLTRY